MAYIRKKDVSSKSKLEKLPYKGGSATLEKLPYRGKGEVKMTPLKQEAKRKAVSGVGAKVTKTNRATGETTTTKKTLTPMKMSRVAKPLNRGNSKASTSWNTRKKEFSTR